MTAGLLLSVYLAALAAFLGLDILSKVPATMYALVLAALGAVCAVALVGSFHLDAQATSENSASLATAAAVLGGAAAGGGLVAARRLARAFVSKRRAG